MTYVYNARRPSLEIHGQLESAVLWVSMQRKQQEVLHYVVLLSIRSTLQGTPAATFFVNI